MSRRAVAPFLALLVGFVTAPLAAQESAPPERIDILVDPPSSEPTVEDCSAEEEAASISGEIVVCRTIRDQGRYRYSQGDEAEGRYAEKTKGGSPVPVNVSNLLPMVGVSVSVRGCFVPPCPPPQPLLIDVAALPEAPPGSDADRIARGLPPLGEDAPQQPSDRGLALPEPPDFASEAVSPAGSAAPEEAR